MDSSIQLLYFIKALLAFITVITFIAAVIIKSLKLHQILELYIYIFSVLLESNKNCVPFAERDKNERHKGGLSMNTQTHTHNTRFQYPVHITQGFLQHRAHRLTQRMGKKVYN